MLSTWALTSSMRLSAARVSQCMVKKAMSDNTSPNASACGCPLLLAPPAALSHSPLFSSSDRSGMAARPYRPGFALLRGGRARQVRLPRGPLVTSVPLLNVKTLNTCHRPVRIDGWHTSRVCSRRVAVGWAICVTGAVTGGAGLSAASGAAVLLARVRASRRQGPNRFGLIGLVATAGRSAHRK